MDFLRSMFPACVVLGLLILVPIALAGQDLDVSTPVDVPDEIGLGERLALVTWLQEHGEPAQDTNDLAAMRAAYLRLAHPKQSAPPPDQEREAVTLQLWLKHSVNADPAATTSQLHEQLALLNQQSKQSDDEQRAKNDSLAAEQRRKEKNREAQAPDAAVTPRPSSQTAGQTAAKTAGQPAAAAPAAALPAAREEPWLRHQGEINSSIRIHRRLMRVGFLAQGQAGKPWAAEALAYLDDHAVLMAHALATPMVKNGLSERGQKLLEAGCDDPLVLYRHSQVTAWEPTEKLIKRAYHGIANSAYPPLYRSICAQRTLASYWYSKEFGPTSQEAIAIQTTWLEASRQMMHENVTDPVQRQIYARWLVNDSTQAYMGLLYDLVEKEARTTIDPWLAEAILGQVEIRKAWKSRGSGWAKEVTADGWKGFSEHLKQARVHLEKAWEIDPSLALPADQMITVSMGSDTDRADMQMWFKRAITASPENIQAWRSLTLASQPQWGGSKQDLLTIARQALDNGHFDSEVPWFYLAAFTSEDEDAARLAVSLDPNVWKDLQQIFEGYLAEPDWASLQPMFFNQYAGYAYASRRYDTCRRIMARYGKPLNQKYFNGGNLEPALKNLAERASPSQTYVVRHVDRSWYVFYDGPDQIWNLTPFHSEAEAKADADQRNQGGAP